MNFTIIVTLGPSILSKPVLEKIDRYKCCVLRINGAHTEPSAVEETIGFVRSILPKARFLLDLPGNKIRTASLTEGICLKKGECFELHPFQLNYPQLHTHLRKGDRVLANDSIYSFIVKKVTPQAITLESESEGQLISNKGLHIKGINERLPFLFQKDMELIDAALKADIDILGLSYVRSADDVRGIQKMLVSKKKSQPELLVKVETAEALRNLKGILDVSDSILIDRGDLCSDIGMLELPLAQEKIIGAALRKKRKVFLATQFLRGMLESPVPLIAETIDLYRTVQLPIAGLQLSEETAVGEYPLECIDMVVRTWTKTRRTNKR